MAGIGFKLRKLLEEDTYSGYLKGYLYSAVISCGPWIFSIICFAMLSFFSPYIFTRQDDILFRATIIYTFAYAMILTGGIQIIISRYISDKLFLGKKEEIVPSFLGVFVITTVLSLIVSCIFFYYSEGLLFAYKLAGIGLFVVISNIFVIMLFLSASHRYNTIVIGYFCGCVMSFFMALGLGHIGGLAGYINGYLLGQFILLLVLIYNIMQEFKMEALIKFDFLTYFYKDPVLFLLGIFYTLAIWIDKLLFWYGPTQMHIKALYYTHFPYDVSVFMSYLTAIPSMTIFLIIIETDFYEKYKGYYGGIDNKETFRQLELRRKQMKTSLISSATAFFKVQGLCTFLAYYFAPNILIVLNAGLFQLNIFRACILGTFFQMLFMIAMLLCLYFDFQKQVLFGVFFFFITNLILTKISLVLGFDYYGYGYLASSILSSIVMVLIFIYLFKNLHHLTFLRQRIEGEKIIR